MFRCGNFVFQLGTLRVGIKCVLLMIVDVIFMMILLQDYLFLFFLYYHDQYIMQGKFE